MRALSAFLLASVSLSAVCQAADVIPVSDSQIRVVSYSPLKRTEVTGIVDQPTIFTFPKGESIYRVVQSGKPNEAAWQGEAPEVLKDSALGNNLTLWPSRSGQSTMSVITMTSDSFQKVYPFRLTALPSETDIKSAETVVLNLIFQGSGGLPSAIPIAGNNAVSSETAHFLLPKRHIINQPLAKEHLRTDAFNGADSTCHYEAQGKRPNSITPLCPMDNGQWTLIRFPGLSHKPAVYVGTCRDEDNERLARQHGTGDFVVVEEIAPHFCVRLGSEVLAINNLTYDPVGKPTNTGTISPNVQRDIIQAKAP